MATENDPLDELFRRYREACPEAEPSADFMPSLWKRIESRSNFWLVFEGLGRKVTTASAALCLILLALNLMSSSSGPLALNYTDALMADHTAEKTYYTEGIRNTSADDQSPMGQSRQ
jgi:hypothetical protein